MPLLDISVLQPALSAYHDATSDLPPVQRAVYGVTQDPRVRQAMLMGALLEGGNLNGGWSPGDNGTSWGPWQIHGPAHPDITQQQAEDPAAAAAYMAPAYAQAVARIPDAMWQSNPTGAAAMAAYLAERPAYMYPPERIVGAAAQLGGSVMGGPSTPQAGFGGVDPTQLQLQPGNGQQTVAGGFGGVDPTALGYGQSRYINVGSGVLYDTQTGQFVRGPVNPLDVAGLGIQQGQLGVAQENAGTSARNAQTSAAAQIEQARSDRVNEAINYINQLASQQQMQDQLAQAHNSAILNALPYAVAPGQDYFPGFGPNDPAVQAGLAGVQKIAATPFNAANVGTMNPAYTNGLAAMRGLLG